MKNNLVIATMVILFALIGCNNKKPTINKMKSWELNSESSSIAIVTTKNNSVSETSDFTSFSGNIDKDGNLLITIDLSSLETNIPIRNQRVQKHLFQTDLFPTADIHTTLKPSDLEIGVHSISFDVDLHGVSGIVDGQFMVFEQQGKKIITLYKPLIIHANMFGLENGITTLKNLARLETIDLTVPLNIILTFEAKNQ